MLAIPHSTDALPVINLLSFMGLAVLRRLDARKEKKRADKLEQDTKKLATEVAQKVDEKSAEVVRTVDAKNEMLADIYKISNGRYDALKQELLLSSGKCTELLVKVAELTAENVALRNVVDTQNRRLSKENGRKKPRRSNPGRV